MSLKRLSLLLLSLLSIQSFAQQFTQTVRGTVYDSELDMALPGANVIIMVGDEMRGVSTDAQGRFKLEEIPVGRQTLKVTFMGYDEIVRTI